MERKIADATMGKQLETLDVQIKSDLKDSDSKSGVSSTMKVCKNPNSRNPKKRRMGAKGSGEVSDKATGLVNMPPIAANKYEKRELLSRVPLWKGIKGFIDLKPLKGIKGIEEAPEAIASTAIPRNIPPYNMEAREAEMVYPLDKIIQDVEWYFLQDIFETVQGGSALSPDVYPRFVCNRVHKLQNAKDESSSRRLAGILSYITHLIRFKEQHSIDYASSAMDHILPGIFYGKFSSMFAEFRPEPIHIDKLNLLMDKWIPPVELDLLIGYVLVLTLFADDFHTDPADIAKDLRIHPLIVRDHYHYLGCKFVCENQSMVATLPVPLKFAAPREFPTIERKRLWLISHHDLH